MKLHAPALTYTIILAIRYEANMTDANKTSIYVTALSIDTQIRLICRNRTLVDIYIYRNKIIILYYLQANLEYNKHFYYLNTEISICY